MQLLSSPFDLWFLPEEERFFALGFVLVEVGVVGFGAGEGFEAAFSEEEEEDEEEKSVEEAGE